MNEDVISENLSAQHIATGDDSYNCNQCDFWATSKGNVIKPTDNPKPVTIDTIPQISSQCLKALLNLLDLNNRAK